MEQIEEKNGAGKKKNTGKALWIILTLAVALAALLWALVPWDALTDGRNRVDYTEETPLGVSEENLSGNYDVRFDYADSLARFVGVINRDINGSYVLTILSDMAPKVLKLSIDGDGKISCDELGRGTVSYKPAIDKTIIRFTGEDYICTLTK